MRAIADALPNARYVEFAGVGHFPEVEAAEAFSASVCGSSSQSDTDAALRGIHAALPPSPKDRSRARQ
jgi:hypothetical protein